MDNEQLVYTSSADETIRLGENIGQRLRGGEVIELSSDLGGGKTTLVRGLAAGAGSKDHVSSPTFTVSKVYKAKTFDIHHFDFYRLPEAGLMEHELADLLHDSKTVIIVEWAQLVEHVLPEKRIRIEILQTEDDGREIHMYTPDSLAYLIEES